MPPLGGSACNHWSPARVHYSQVTTKIGSTLEIANFHPGQQKFIVDVWEKTCHRHALSGLEGRVVLRSSRETVSARSTRVFVQARLETKNRNWQHTCLCNHHVSTPTAAPRSSRRIVHHSGSTSAPAFWSSKQSPDPLLCGKHPPLPGAVACRGAHTTRCASTKHVTFAFLPNPHLRRHPLIAVRSSSKYPVILVNPADSKYLRSQLPSNRQHKQLFIFNSLYTLELSETQSGTSSKA